MYTLVKENDKGKRIVIESFNSMQEAIAAYNVVKKALGVTSRYVTIFTYRGWTFYAGKAE